MSSKTDKGRKGRTVPVVGDNKVEKVPTRVIYLNLPVDLAALLQAEAESEDRPMSVQAARIIKKHFESKAS